MTEPLTAPAQVRRSRAGYGVLRGVGALVAALLIGGATISLVPDMARQEATSTVTLAAASLGALQETRSVLVEGALGGVVVRETREGESPTVTTNSRWASGSPS